MRRRRCKIPFRRLADATHVGLGRPARACRQRLADGPLHGNEDHTAVGEANLGLGGMDVDVHQVGRSLEEEKGLGAGFANPGGPVSLDHGLGDRAVAHRPAVHEEPQ